MSFYYKDNDRRFSSFSRGSRRSVGEINSDWTAIVSSVDVNAGHAAIEESKNNAKPLVLPSMKNFTANAGEIDKFTNPFCQAKYGKRKFRSEATKRLPPILYSFPGAGNTWMRLLIEFTTGIYTGSVYNDHSLADILPGTLSCDWYVSVVKVHPHSTSHSYAGLFGGTFTSDGMKCKKGNVVRFERAIVLVRNPFDSIWSEFQRRLSKSHVGGIKKADFNWATWYANAAELSHHYLSMMKRDYPSLKKNLAKSDLLIIEYDNLTNKSTRLSVLKQVSDFLGDPASTEKISCAFKLADHAKVKRSVGEMEEYIGKDVAFTPKLVCTMWNLFGSYAAKFGYKPWKNINNCTAYPNIPNAAVGPNGEFTKKFLRNKELIKLFNLLNTTESGTQAAVKKKLMSNANAGKRKKNPSVSVRDTGKNSKLSLPPPNPAHQLGMSIAAADSIGGVSNRKVGYDSPAWSQNNHKIVH